MAWYRQDVRQFVPGQELVASERLFGHRGRKGRNGKALPKRRRQNGRTRSLRRKVWLGSQLSSMQGTEERSWSSPSTGTNGRPTATEILTQTTNDKGQYSECDQNKTAVGTGDGETEWKVQPQLFFWFRAWFWIRWGWTISVPTWVQNVNLKKKLSENQNGKKDWKFLW